MKVAIIDGQSHHGVSHYIGTRLLSSLGVKEAKEFFLPKDMAKFCLGCYACMKQGAEFCPHNQDMTPIWNAIVEADILVFTTPVYCLRASGSMKAFLDHCFVHWIAHRPCKSMYLKKQLLYQLGLGRG